jgi:hypothetical protein
MKIELKKISFSERMSDETNCFIADLYINGKKVGECNNDGRGGCTNYGGNTKEDNVLIAEAEKYCKTLPKVKSEKLKFEYAQSLESVIDDILTEFLVAKELKKKQKMFLKAFCYGVPNGYSYRTSSWTGRTLAQVDKITLQRAYNKIKSELKTGEVFLNTNLQTLGINL